MKPTWASRPSAKAAEMVQKRRVRTSAARRSGAATSREAPLEAPAGAVDPAGATAAGRESPSGPRPSTSGPRCMNSATSGTRTTSMRPTTTSAAPGRPSRGISAAQSRTMSTPPHVAPFMAMLTARPRLRSNHGATIALIPAPLMPAQPTAMSAEAGGRCRRVRGKPARDPMLDSEASDRARIARDARFDGRFVSGVLTTRIYCRPACPVRPARSANVIFFPTAAAAETAGFRPCLRCRPETAPGSAAWRGTAATVSRALRLIDQGALDEGRVGDLAAALGVGARHLTRLFLDHVGAPPTAAARTRRVQLPKTLLSGSRPPLTEVAFAGGSPCDPRLQTGFPPPPPRPPASFRPGGP